MLYKPEKLDEIGKTAMRTGGGMRADKSIVMGGPRSVAKCAKEFGTSRTCRSDIPNMMEEAGIRVE
jgi:hypothetical protein